MRERRRRKGGAPGEASPGARAADAGRFSSGRKMEAVVRLLQGESLDEISRDVGVTAATLSEWRDTFLAAGQSGLKSRNVDFRDDEKRRLQAKIGELMMSIEIYQEFFRRRGIELPFPPGRSRS